MPPRSMFANCASAVHAFAADCIGWANAAMLLLLGLATWLRATLDYASELGGALVHLPPVIALLLPFTCMLVHLRYRAWRRLGTLALFALMVLPQWFGLHTANAKAAQVTWEPQARITTFNVEKWSHGASAIAAAIRRIKPDALCIQEAGSYFWQQAPDQRLPALRELLPDYQVAGAGEVWVFSKWPIVQSRVVAFEQQEGTRPIVIAQLAQPNGKLLHVLCVHLYPAHRFGGSSQSWHATARIRQAQIAKLAQVLADEERMYPGAARVLLGDFNTPATCDALAPLSASMRDLWPNLHAAFGYTSPAAFPFQRIDRIFASAAVQALAIRVEDEQASDHLPLTADIQLQ